MREGICLFSLELMIDRRTSPVHIALRIRWNQSDPLGLAATARGFVATAMSACISRGIGGEGSHIMTAVFLAQVVSHLFKRVAKPRGLKGGTSKLGRGHCKEERRPQRVRPGKDNHSKQSRGRRGGSCAVIWAALLRTLISR